jgi:mycofactocin glycosyltransferase
MTGPEHSELPGSFRVSLDAGIEHHLGVNGELVLLGGDPLRLFRLTDRSAALVASLGEGRSLAETAKANAATLRAVSKLCRRLLDAGVAHPTFRSGADSGTKTGQNDLETGSFEPETYGNQPDFGKGPRVTIVVPVKDRPTELERLLRSIRNSTSDVPLIVVDDGSADPAQTIAIATRYRATVLRHEQSRGPGAARNRGANEATTEFVAFVDSDCEIVDSGWLTTCVAQFDDPELAIVAPRIVAAEQTNSNYLYAYEMVRSSLDLGPSPAKVAPMHRVAYVPAAALVVRKNLFVALSGFDEAMHVGEDVDFVWRVNEANHAVRYEPKATVAHEHRTNLAQFLKRRFQYATSSAPLDRRHPNMVPPLVLSPWSAAVWASVATQTPLGILSALGIGGYSVAKFPAKLQMLREPGPVAARLVARGHWGAGRQLASATWRTYLPVALVLSALSKRARRWTIASAMVHNALDYRARKPRMNPLTYIVVRVLDDSAYCAGLWWGCVTNKNLKPLLPKMNNWPGRRNVNEDS